MFQSAILYQAQLCFVETITLRTSIQNFFQDYTEKKKDKREEMSFKKATKIIRNVQNNDSKLIRNKYEPWGMAIYHVTPLRFPPEFRALGVCEHS